MAPSQPVPFVLYSDGPRLPTGLARIARDLASRLYAEQDALGIALLQVGWDPMPGPSLPWPVHVIGSMRMDDQADWGAEQVGEAWRHYFGDAPGILMSIWDASRAWALLDIKGPDMRWGYFPVDGVNQRGSIGGPAAEALHRYDRVLAYGRWGSQVIRSVRGMAVPYLPHGLDLGVWRPEQSLPALAKAEETVGLREGEWALGCVATNQPRKDLSLFFATLVELRRRGHKVRGWLHTDQMVRAWSVPQLAEDFGLSRRVVSVSTTLSDEILSACYAICGVTLAPGLGEGFGYPIVESLACGTPVVHGDYAGGAELVPMNAWRMPWRASRLEGIYGIRRPVFDPVDIANAVERARSWKASEERVCQEYCRGSVAHLAWPTLWPRWRSWVKQGLLDYRG